MENQFEKIISGIGLFIGLALCYFLGFQITIITGVVFGGIGGGIGYFIGELLKKKRQVNLFITSLNVILYFVAFYIIISIIYFAINSFVVLNIPNYIEPLAAIPISAFIVWLKIKRDKKKEMIKTQNSKEF